MMKSFTSTFYAFFLLLTHFIQASCPHCNPCGTVPFPPNTGLVTPDPILDSPDVWRFESEPNLRPMKVTVSTNKSAKSSGLIFLAPYANSSDATYGQSGALILDDLGNPVWFRPLSSPNLMNTDFRVQTLNGKSVLTFWQGTIATAPGYTNLASGSPEPNGCFYILDNTYRVIKTVKAQHGFVCNLHEFLITPDNTALCLCSKKVPMDLTSYGGPQDGFIYDVAVQEIDLNRDKLVFFWNALDHIPLTDSYLPASNAFDFENVWDVYHLNAIGLTDNKDEIIVSGRNTWTIYKINKTTGKIAWHLGGKQNNFTMGPGTHFSWQHDPRFLSNHTMSLFDDNCCESSTIPPQTPPAHGLTLKLNFENMTAILDRTYFHDPLIQVSSQGSVQNLDHGNKFIGWGDTQYYSEYKKEGNTVENPSLNTVYRAKMPGNNITYRAFRNEWTGKPFYSPTIAINAIDHLINIYTSWNGSTQTTAWKVLGGDHPDHLHKINIVKKSGFETLIQVKDIGPYFQVKALNKRGKVIGKSNIVFFRPGDTPIL